MDKNKPHLNWKLFLESSQLPLGPIVGSSIKNRPSMRVDPNNPDPDIERELDPEELALMLRKVNSENPATGMQKDDRDFINPNSKIKLKFSNASDFESADTWDIKDDERIRKAIEDFNKIKGNLPTLDVKKLEELILKEIRNILNERNKANIH